LLKNLALIIILTLWDILKEKKKRDVKRGAIIPTIIVLISSAIITMIILIKMLQINFYQI
jgi:hypothetical protein